MGDDQRAQDGVHHWVEGTSSEGSDGEGDEADGDQSDIEISGFCSSWVVSGWSERFDVLKSVAQRLYEPLK